MFEGGYMNDEPQTINSVSVGGDEKTKSIAAVSISQVSKLTRPDDGLLIRGKKIYHINLVAYVYEIIDSNPQKIQLLLDDFSSGGPLEMTHIIGDTGGPDLNENVQGYPDEGKPRDLSSLKQGDYVRCIGVVKWNQDKANLVAYNVRIIEDPNEVTAHILEVIRDSIYYERMQTGNPMPIIDGVKKSVRQDNQREEFGNLSNRDKHVLRYMREKATTDTGVHLDDICGALKAFSRDEVVSSLQLLSTEGLCWVGDSEDVWCVNTE